jgi:hypothetical protein
MNNIVTPTEFTLGKHGVRILKRYADVNEVEPFFSYVTGFLAFIHKCVICGS